MNLESDTGRPERDYTFFVWLGVALVLCAMIVGLYYWAQPEPVTSQARVRHILIPLDAAGDEARRQSYERALEVRRRLREGEDFGRLAREYSGDPGTKDMGGDLGWAPRGVYQDAFEEFVWSAPLRQVSEEPVRTNFGYHIIEVLDRRLTAIDRYEAEIGREALDRILEQEQEAAPPAE